MKQLFKVIVLIAAIITPSILLAETQTGIIRNINCGSHSFGLDLPPVTRVYVNSGTKFESSSGPATCKDIKEGDRVEVDARRQGPGVEIAARVKILGNIAPLKNLASNEIDIKLNQSFVLGVSQTAVLKDGGKPLKLRSTEFINTLCQGYDCGDVGEVGMRLKVSKGGDEEEVLLTSKNSRKPATPVKAEVLGYEIQLMEAGEDVVILVVRKS
jgi:uncharacterized protein DUF5666